MRKTWACRRPWRYPCLEKELGYGSMILQGEDSSLLLGLRRHHKLKSRINYQSKPKQD